MATESKRIYSFLNNDNIDDLKPIPKRARVSSMSLSDQFIGPIPSMSLLNNNINNESLNSSSNNNDTSVPRQIRLSFSNSLLAQPPKFKKSILDHPRIASYAFAFDIDGVLVRGPETITHGIEAIKYLDGNNPYNIKIPYIFVTNGGGKHESLRAKDLSNRLQTNIHIDQIVQGHTPMKGLKDTYENVLIIGGIGNTCKEIAKTYGFKNVFNTYDILKWNPSVTPYYEMNEDDLKYCDSKTYDFNKIKIDAIMIFADSRNWVVDQQIILELLMSKNGFMGTLSDNFEDGPPIYFAHSDFVWSTNYKLVRYGMGALQVSIAALFKEHTGKELKVIRFGKPQRATFNYVEKVLGLWRKDILDDHIEEIKSKPASSCGDSGLTSDIFSNNGDEDTELETYSNVFSISESEEENDENQSFDNSKDEERNILTFQSLNKLKINKTVSESHDNNINNNKNNSKEDLPPPSTVYFVGDTPESDIRFANSHDESWFSILVNTGVYQANTIPKYKPKMQCENVFEAVKFAVEREHQKELDEWNSNAIEIS
ncbi:hypothetical protein C6P40_003576 [Pichia californica]|uniref:Phosphatidyl synthase n=1 Tax=Pichia californica TaxID=460514 RepID=A0A9P6WGB9_9ASCO|nr:hypothetical protein C6P40_003576 [[Candida] californica]